MTQQKALRELRDRLKLSRDNFGRLYKLSGQSIERYEAELTPELAGKFADTATQHGYHDLAKVFLGLGDDQPTAAPIMATLKADEQGLIAALLRFLRDEKPGETYEQFLKGHKQTLESVLKPWMKNISKPKTSKGKKSESAA